MEYEIDGNIYQVIIVKKRNKNTYIRVKEDMNIYVTTNYLTSKSYIRKLLDENVNYLKKMLDGMCKKNEKKEMFFYLGQPYDIIIVSTIKNIDIDNINKIIYVKDNKMLNRWLNNIIRELFYNRFINICNYFEEINVVPSLNIRKMKSRWGVYNKLRHRVTLNSELIKYNIECLDYVIVHELSHVIHFDHSKEFWNLVSKYCKDYKNIRKQLKE